jgi:hypothetical protein
MASSTPRGSARFRPRRFGGSEASSKGRTFSHASSDSRVIGGPRCSPSISCVTKAPPPAVAHSISLLATAHPASYAPGHVWPLHPDQPERPGCSSTVKWGATLQTRLGRVFASFAVRGSSRNLGGFPGAGAWVPVEAAEQLSQHLKLLHAWSKAHEPLGVWVTGER